MHMIIKTTDTGGKINLPALPPTNWDSGYDYKERANKAGWEDLALWGSDGYNFGDWPLIMGFVRVTRILGRSEVYGFGTYVEGDLHTEYFDSQAACNEAISREAFLYWTLGQSEGPSDLPKNFADLQPQYKVPSKY